MNPSVSRREALLGIGGLGVAGALTLAGGQSAAFGRQTSASAGSATPQQGAGFYRFRLGDVECFSIGDSQGRLPAFPLWGENAGEAAVNAALKARAVPPGLMLMHFNVLVIRVGGETWLVDAGNGPSGDRPGQLLTHLATLGIKPEAVTGVILSHLHGDHFAGLFTADNRLTFPNARYLLNKLERDFWTTPDLSKTNLPEAFKKNMTEGAGKALAALTASKKLEIIQGDMKVSGGLSVRHTGGHTPGHQTVVVEGGGQRLDMIVDAVHHFVLSFRNPDWHAQFDVDAKQGAAVRRATLQRLASDGTLVMGYHTPWPGLGNVLPDGDGFAWQPAQWEW